MPGLLRHAACTTLLLLWMMLLWVLSVLLMMHFGLVLSLEQLVVLLLLLNLRWHMRVVPANRFVLRARILMLRLSREAPPQ